MTYRHTMLGCYTGYIVQAIVNNLAPLLYVTFSREYGLSLGLISTLAVINFVIQMTVDTAAAALSDRLSHRALMLAAHISVIAGLWGLALLPGIIPPFAGLLISTFLYAVGGGLLEVLVSPLLEALPLKNKASAMSLLHSFYCWGHVAVVVLSTIFFTLVGVDSWKLLPLLWSAVPLANLILFIKVPIVTLEDNAPSMPRRKLLKNSGFWIFMVLMLCAGAAEQSMSQWASAFAETGLMVSKTVGDLLGPCLFAVLMGTSRAFYGKKGEKINLTAFMTGCGILCALSYLGASLIPIPQIALLCCGLCGLSVGIMWPGTFSSAAKSLPSGGTAMFALLALGGDIGCAAGPALVGLTGEIRSGLLLAVIFPIILIILLQLMKNRKEMRA